MSRALLILNTDADRSKAMHWIQQAPVGCRVEFKRARRSNDQNALMWLLLTELSEKLEWHGQHLAPEDWKDFLMHAYRQARWVPAEGGAGMVPIGMRTSDLSKDEMGELIELIQAFAARQGVAFSINETEAA